MHYKQGVSFEACAEAIGLPGTNLRHIVFTRRGQELATKLGLQKFKKKPLDLVGRKFGDSRYSNALAFDITRMAVGRWFGCANVRAASAFDNMHQRCKDLGNKNYGGRGIAVAPEWSNTAEGFGRFLHDMKNTRW